MAAVNYIDSLLASAPYRIIGSPSNNPTPVGVTVTPVSGGAARDITITWSYTQGVIPASSFGIVWVPSSSAPTKTDNFIAVPLGQTSYTFKGIDPATTYRIGILALQEDIFGDVISPTVTPNWIVAAGVTNYSGLVSGITAANVASAVASIVDDGIISVIEKVGLRVYWNTILGEKSGINAQATAYGITTENTTYNTKFQLLANFLNGGTWTTGYPLYINDTNKDVETNIGETERGTFLTVSKDFELAKSALLTKIAEISGTKSTWTGTTGPGKPADNATVGAPTGTYVGGTLAETVESNAATALSNANNAQTTANNVATAVTSIIADNVLSPPEKSATRAQWDAFAAEKAGLDSQATAYGITTEKTNYDNAFQAMATYLNNGTTWTSGVPDWISDANLGNNTTIVGATFRSTINGYMNARTELFKKISDVAATKAAWPTVSNKPDSVYNTNLAVANGFNPTFSSWSGTYPDKWARWSTGGTVTKESSIKRIGDFAVRFVSAANNVTDGISSAQSLGSLDANTVLHGSIDVYINSVTTGRPGVLIGVLGASGWLSAVYFQPDTSSTSIWQTINFTMRGDGVNKITGFAIYIGCWAWTGGGFPFIGDCIFDNLILNQSIGADFDNKKQQASDIQGQLNAATQLLDASLTAAKTAIAAINPASGNLSAAQAAVIQGFFGSLSALSANLGTVTAGTLDSTGYVRARGAVSVAGYNSAIVANDSVTQQVGAVGYGTVVGVWGRSSAAIGVAGDDSSSGVGVRGSSSSGTAVYGISSSGYGVGCQSSSNYALYVNGTSYFSGTMSCGSSSQVSNLNATYVGGYSAGNFAFSGHTHSNYCSTITTDNGPTASCSSNTFYFASELGSYQFSGFNGNGVKLKYISDIRLKQDISPETLSVDFIKQLKPVSFRLKKDPEVKHHGFIAQDIQPLIDGPYTDSLKRVHEDGTFGVDYMSLIAPIVKTLQEILTRLETLENQNGNI